MKPFPTTTYSNFQFDAYKDLPVTVLEHFEWAHENISEGGTIIIVKVAFLVFLMKISLNVISKYFEIV